MPFLDYKLSQILDSVNSTSKIVDENGEPKVVYHGTGTEGIEVFDHKKAQDKTGRKLGFGLGKGKFYLTDSKSSAEMAASAAAARGDGKTPNVMSVYLDISIGAGYNTDNKRVVTKISYTW